MRNNMKQFITAFIHNWSPLHLRKRVAKLEHDLDHLTEMRDNFISEVNRHNVKENERLEKVISKLAKEKKRLLNQMGRMIHELETQTLALKRYCEDFTTDEENQQ